MSIINDALKKAENKSKISIDMMKTNAKRFVLNKWLIWAGTGAICFLGIISMRGIFSGPGKDVPAKDPAPKTVSSPTEQPLKAGIKPKKRMGKEASLAAPHFTLNGIVYDKDNPLAIINEQIVEEGAVINNAQILEIQSDFVRMSLEGKEIILRLE